MNPTPATTGPLRVVTCWDDGNLDDIRLCELFRKYGAKASFNLNPGQHRAERYEAWKADDVYPVYRLSWAEMPAVYDGFTIANHTVNHPWASKISLDEWRGEVVDGRKRLQDHFQQPVSGFAYPFGDYTPETARIVGEAGHVYARTCVSVTPCFPPADPLLMPADCHHADAAFWQRYAEAKLTPGGVFYFWGHSYEFTNEEQWAAIEAKIARITADPDSTWADLPDLFTPAI